MLNSTVQPEVVTYTVKGGSSGSINLKLVRISGGKITYNVNTTIAYGCTDIEFGTALNKFNSFSNYKFSVTRTIYSGTNVINTLSGASSIVYTVSFYLLRPQAYSTEDFIYTYTNFTGTVAKASLQTHSPLISGTFKLTIGGNDFTGIPFDSKAAVIQSYFNSIVGYERVTVDLNTLDGCGYSATWIIKYVGVIGTIPNVTVNGAGLSGGSSSPTIVLTVRRSYSSRILFESVDYRFLNTASNQLSVLVKTNGVPAVCTGTCRYTFNDVSTVTSLSLTGTTLSFSIANQANLTIGVSSITVLVQGNPCKVDLTSSASALRCTLATNADGTPLLVAGSFVPTVYINPFGYSSVNSVTPIPVSLIASSLSTPEGGVNGGYYNTLNGNGFPMNKAQVTIAVCGKNANIISSTNRKIKFSMPSCGSTGAKPVTVTVGNLSDSSVVFSYNNGSGTIPTITAVSPISRNPALKGVLTINGTNFGYSASALTIFLSNSSGKVYQLNVIDAQDTYVLAGLSGGLAGSYFV